MNEEIKNEKINNYFSSSKELEEQVKKLEVEISKERSEIKRDSYSMSIGELVSNFLEGDINLKPSYQRLYRWSKEHKTNFIESILLGIPIPPIFVSQLSNGKWDVIDGVQRISTILQFLNKLDGYEKLILEDGKLLPSLKGLTYDTIGIDALRLFRKGKITINIILTENSIKAQYEMFQRLNTGGMILTDQEIRNTLLILGNQEFYKSLEELKSNSDFKKLLKLNNKRLEEDYHLELLNKYFIAKYCDLDTDSRKVKTLSDYLDMKTEELFNDNSQLLSNFLEDIKKLKDTFKYLNENYGYQFFRKYNIKEKKHENQFSSIAYDILLIGITENLEKIKRIGLNKVIVDFYKEKEVQVLFDRGKNTTDRYKKAVKFSKRYFNNLGE